MPLFVFLRTWGQGAGGAFLLRARVFDSHAKGDGCKRFSYMESPPVRLTRHGGGYLLRRLFGLHFLFPSIVHGVDIIMLNNYIYSPKPEAWVFFLGNTALYFSAPVDQYKGRNRMRPAKLVLTLQSCNR